MASLVSAAAAYQQHLLDGRRDPVRRQLVARAGVLQADQAGADAGDEGRTKKDQQTWLGTHEAFSADLVEWNGQKWEGIGGELARQVAEALRSLAARALGFRVVGR